MSSSVPPIYSNYNQYGGINAHLQGKLQQTNGGWSMFHDQHINAIAESLNQLLPPNYYTTTEDSLQIATRSEPEALVLKHTPTLEGYPERPVLLEASPEAHSLTYLGLLEVATERYQKAAVLYQRGPEEDIPITRLELLSPSNIGVSREALAYDKKREETLTAGINLIEIHYLHESPPPAALRAYVPVYAVGYNETRAPDSTAYYIAVTAPREQQTTPDAADTFQIPLNVTVYPFGVETPIPVIKVPLAEGDPPLHLNLQSVYDEHFYKMRWGRAVNYAEGAPALASYSPADRLLVDARTLTVQQAVRAGANLETGQKRLIDFEQLNKLTRRSSEESQIEP